MYLPSERDKAIFRSMKAIRDAIDGLPTKSDYLWFAAMIVLGFWVGLWIFA